MPTGHGGGSGRCGHTRLIARAGRYERAEAERLCEEANRGVSVYQTPNEVMVLAPECLETVVTPPSTSAAS
jgi:hypothetical protein